MILFYFSDSKQILNYYPGFESVETVAGKLYVGGTIITNSTEGISYKYIVDQILEKNDGGFVHDANYYAELTPQPTAEERLATLEAAIATDPSIQEQIDAIVELLNAGGA